eukprot:c24833_g1_i3 orf=187-990(-)
MNLQAQLYQKEMTTVSDTSPCPCQKVDHNCMGEHSTSDIASVPSSNFDCSICLDLPQDPVVTMCGHLFCWSCLYQWITIHSVLEECPVCKALVKDKVIPLYGRGRVGLANPKAKQAHTFNIPRRPSAHWSDVTAASRPPATGFQQHSFRSHENFVNRRGHSMASVPLATGFQHHSFISPENHASRRGHVAHSAAAFGLFPALFGFHMTTFPEYSSGFSSGAAYNVPCRLPGIDGMTSWRRWNAQHEFFLSWFLFLLASFAILCFLFF